MASTFKPNVPGIASIAKSVGVQSVCNSAATRIRDRIRNSAPVNTGRYRDSWVIRTNPEGGVNLISTDFKAMWIEKGIRPYRGHPGFTAMHIAYRAIESQKGGTK